MFIGSVDQVFYSYILIVCVTLFRIWGVAKIFYVIVGTCTDPSHLIFFNEIEIVAYYSTRNLIIL